MRRWRSILTVKLLRDLWRLRAQSLAIALVIAAGVGTVVMAAGLIRSLETTRAEYYDRYRFADVFAPLVRAPEIAMEQVRRIPGVAAADSRISASATLDVAGVVEPVSARVHSLPPARGSALNQLVLRSGRMPHESSQAEVVATENFALAAGLALGDSIPAVIHGKQVRLRLVGMVLSPEYVYTLAPGHIVPDDRRYGVIWMQREPLAALLDLKQSFNDLLVRLSPGVPGEEVVRQLDILLAPYGGVSAYTRSQQISDRFISSEIDQLRTMALVLPPVFLLVAAFLLNIVLARLVDTEREIIGLLKAFGFPVRAIMLHYLALAVLLSLGGLALGMILGNWLGRLLAAVYQNFYSFPFLSFRAGADVFLAGAASTLVPVAFGAATAVWRSARLTPAQAMQPPSPPDYSGRAVSGIVARLGPDEPSRIILRGLLRQPVRSLLSILGLGAALALYIAAQSAPASIERMIALGFNEANRADLVVTFAEPRDARALHELQQVPGILAVQPFRVVSARLQAGPRTMREGLSGIEPRGDLERLVNMAGEAMVPPREGVLISGRMASMLAVGRGDVIEARVTEGERPLLRLTVADIVQSPFGSSATLDRALLNRLMHEGDVASGANLLVDARQLPRINAWLKQSPMVAGIRTNDAALRSVRSTIAQNIGTMTLFYGALAVLVVAGVVYNNARISLSERARDLASLRVLGFRRGEVAFILLGEQAVLLLLSLPFGILGGIALWRYLAQRFNSDLFTIPFVIDTQVIGQGVVIVAATAALTAWLIRLRLDRLDLVRALKTRE